MRTVVIALEPRGILCGGETGDDALRGGELQAVASVPCLRAVRGSLGPFVLVARDDAGHTLRATGHGGKARGEVRGGRRFVMRELADDRRPTTGLVGGGTGSPWKRGELIFTDVDRVHSEHLLKPTRRRRIRTDTQTGTHEFFLDRAQVIHPAVIVHTVSHVGHLLTAGPRLVGDVTEISHLLLMSDVHGGFEVILLDDEGFLHEYRFGSNFRWF